MANNKKTGADLDREYDIQTKELIRKTVKDLLNKLEPDLAQILVMSACKLDNIHFADILTATNEAQKRRDLLRIIRTTENDADWDQAMQDLRYFGYTIE